jgi:hypothetical protein
MHEIARTQAAKRNDAAFETLHRAGWSLGEIAGTNGHYVYGIVASKSSTRTAGMRAKEGDRQSQERQMNRKPNSRRARLKTPRAAHC